MYKKHSKLRGGSIVVFFLFILITFTLNPTNVTGDWTEDFSDNDLSDWELFSTDWGRDDGIIQLVEHGMYVENGNLKTDGLAPSDVTFQAACRSFDFVLKTWSGDVYNAPGWGWGLLIGGHQDWTQNLTLAEMPIVPYYYLIFWDIDMNWDYASDPNVPSDVNVSLENEVYIGLVDTSGWHSYLFEFNETQFDLYMDEDLIFSHAPSHTDKAATFDTFDSMCLSTFGNTANMYDNITMTGEESTNGPTSPDSGSDNGDAAFTILVFGSGSIMAITSLYTLNRYFKKKE